MLLGASQCQNWRTANWFLQRTWQVSLLSNFFTDTNNAVVCYASNKNGLECCPHLSAKAGNLKFRKKISYPFNVYISSHSVIVWDSVYKNTISYSVIMFCHFDNHFVVQLIIAKNPLISTYRESPARSRAASIRACLVEWFYKPWLVFGKYFPNERLGWLVYETQHLPIYIHLRGWLEYESGLSNELFFQTKINLNIPNISRVASGRGLTVLEKCFQHFNNWSWWVLGSSGVLFFLMRLFRR